MDKLKSKKGVDYTRLDKLLADRNWKEADQETIRVMLKATGLQNTLSSSDVKKLDCEDLHIIDNLWRKYSQGRFGLSAQARIFQQEQQDYYKFCDRVGWRNNGTWKSYNELTWNLDALEGHLPHTQGRYLFPTQGEMTNLRLNSIVLNLGDYFGSSMEFLGINERPIIHLLAERLTECKISPQDLLSYRIEEQQWYVPGFPETQEIPEDECGSLKQEIDVVLITATDVELKAVANLLQPCSGRQKILLVYSGAETYYLGQFGAYNTVITKCRMGAIGEGSVILATLEAQRLWHPRAIIMVGIAFGKDPSTQKVGDVLVASQIISYEQQRLGSEIIYRGSIPASNTTLLNRFENAQNWRFKRPDGSLCRLIVGLILSGEKLIDNPDFKINLFKQFPQAVGGEMEGAGLCAASGRLGTAWILVKSICDWADGTKDKKHQPLAAAAAASLVHYVLSQETVLNGIQKPVSS